MKVDLYGISGFSLSLSVSTEEMGTWSVEAIEKFFAGLAQMVSALNPENGLTCDSSTDISNLFPPELGFKQEYEDQTQQ